MAATTTAVVAEGLRKRYGATKALDGFDLIVPTGIVHGLLGPNGAGKTTAIRILSTLVRCDAGRARVAGFDVVNQPGQVRRQIGLTGQYAAVDEILSGRQNLILFGRLYHLGARAARRRADELLAQFDLADAAGKSAKEYSGGMRRRLDLAASLILTPRVLFLDEPTTGLDPRSRNQMWDVIRSLVAGGTTVLLTTQYLQEADQLADRISVVDAGRVVAEGTPDELKSTIGGDRIEVVVHDAHQLDAAADIVRRACAAEPDRNTDMRKLTAPARDPVAALTEVVQALHHAQIAVDDVGLRRPTLDEAFLHLTSRPTKEENSRDTPLDRAEIVAAEQQATPPSSLRAALVDGWTMIRRNMAHVIRAPEEIVLYFSLPIMFVLVFGYVFGSGMAVPGDGNYREFLLPGVFVMTMLYGLGATATGVAADVNRGVVDRFRSMPMARSALVTGRSGADLLRALLEMTTLVACGLLVGWRWRNDLGDAALAVALILLLRFALTWIGIFLGLIVPNPDTVSVIVFPLAFPLTAVSNVFVAPDLMPGWLGTVSAWNPLSATVAAARQLFGNPGIGGDSWVAQHPLLLAVVWPGSLIAIFAPLAVLRYQRLNR